MAHDTLVIVLAGGAGERLYPLTKERAKPAVYFGGPYRIIDFTLSNCINSGLRRIFIATQYKSLSLNRHIRMGWKRRSPTSSASSSRSSRRRSASASTGTSAPPTPSTRTSTPSCARTRSTSSSSSGDHVYKMDYARMLRFHRERGAAATIACLEVPVEDATRFGIVQVDDDGPGDRLPGEAEAPHADSGLGRHGAGVDGHLRLRGRRARSRARSRRARGRRTTTSARTSCPR